MTATRSVLVVDDDEDIRESLIGCLEAEGYRPVGAANGQRALELLAQLDALPCLILLDLMMPVMDGRRFREEQLRSPVLSQIPVVMISAYAPDPAAVARDLKIDECLPKPVDPTVLLELIGRYCNPKPAD